MYCISVCTYQWQKMTSLYIRMARWTNKATGAKLPLGARHCWNTWVAFQPNGSLGGESPKGKRSDHHPVPCVLSRDNRAPWPLTAALFVPGGRTAIALTWMKIESKHPMAKDYSFKEMVKDETSYGKCEEWKKCSFAGLSFYTVVAHSTFQFR